MDNPTGPSARLPTLGAVTSIEVDPEALVELGRAFAGVAADLQWQATQASEEAWALGPGDSATALASALGDFEHRRQLLGRELDDLAARLAQAGRLYLEVDLEVGSRLDPRGSR